MQTKQDALFNLDGRVAIITGASSGCGLVMAQGLAAAGASVVLAARRLDRLEALAARIKKDGGEAVAIACDVTKPDDVERAVAFAVETYGGLDVMVNNAGQLAGGGAMPERLSDEDAARNVQVNLLGVWYGCQRAAAHMLASGKGGSIINISSSSAMGGWPDQAPLYGASKAGVNNLTQTLAASWGDRGVRVNALVLGFFPSEMSEHFLAVPEGVAFAEGHIALGRVARGEELIGPVVFLASDASSYLTGATIALDGGVAATLGHRMPQAFYDMLAAQAGDIGKRIGAG